MLIHGAHSNNILLKRLGFPVLSPAVVFSRIGIE